MKRVIVFALFGLFVLATASVPGCLSPQATPSPTTPTGTPTATPAPATPSPTQTPSPTATPSASTRSPTSSPTPTPTVAPEADTDAAVQTILNYYTAINNQNYQQAYDYWSGNGQASGQTLSQFTQGYTSTVRVDVQLGMPAEQGAGTARSVTQPITLTSVVNQSITQQAVKHYQGTYTLEPGPSAATQATGWVISSASVNEVPGTSQPPADLADPVALLQSYYEAINQKQYARAYTYWDNLGQASNQTFAQFRAGFATTQQDVIQMGTPQSSGAAGSIYASVPITITANQTDGTTKTFTGTYTVRRSDVPPFDQLGWRIESANLKQR